MPGRFSETSGAAMGANLRFERYIRQMTDTPLLDRDDAVVGRHGAIKLHGPEGFAGMRAAGRVAAEILDMLVPHVVAGVTTAELDDIVYSETRARGAIPATLGYRGYTKSCCTSINHVVCHGIPGDRPLRDGDIVNVDVTPILDGWHGDSSRMYCAFPVKRERIRTKRSRKQNEACTLTTEGRRPSNGSDLSSNVSAHTYDGSVHASLWKGTSLPMSKITLVKSTFTLHSEACTHSSEGQRPSVGSANAYD